MNTKERIEELRAKISAILINLLGDCYLKIHIDGTGERSSMPNFSLATDQILALLEPKMSVLSEEEIVKIFQEVRELNGSDLDIIHALSGKIISADRNAGKSTGSFGKAADTTIGGISKPQSNKGGGDEDKSKNN